MASIKEWICKYEMDCNSRIAMRKISLSICASLLFSTSSFAINCKDFGGEFATYSGHYYAITGNKMTFETAKQFATSNGGYLAIPNTTAENDFVKGIVGANSEAFLGIYDPNYSQNFCLTGNCFSTNRTRFKTVAGASLTYQNWDSTDVENKLLNGDDSVDLYGKRVIQTLGEPYAIISGTSGLWRDWGTHFISGDNPMTMQAAIEFDTKPTCYEVPNGVTDDVVNKCNTQIWSDTIGMQQGETLDCRADQYGNNYCPSALAPAGTYWDYENGYSVRRYGSTIDYVNSVYTERTGLIRDYANGTSQPNTSTTINYSNGTSGEYTGNIVDYANKVATQVDGSYAATGTLSWILEKSGSVGKSYNSVYGPNADDVYISSNNISFPKNSEYGGSCTTAHKSLINGTRQVEYWINSSWDKSKRGIRIYYWNLYKQVMTYSCSNGGTLNTATNMCETSSTVCPSGYTDNGSNCKKTINYKYYSYGCDSGYSPTNSGFTTYTKIDPDTKVSNESTLDDAVNSATPPANNCTQTLTATAYEYICGTGYTAINSGLTSCPTGTDGACNSSTTPTSNCWKDVHYKFYEYGCPSSYTTNNHGLTACTKTDPNNQTNNEATLSDVCNAVTAPDGNCQKPVSYSYYEYLCLNSANEQGINFSATNTGMTSCNKTDTSNTTDNTATLDDSCNSSTPPADNCKRQGFACNSTESKAAYINESWQCSPFPCLNNDNFENAGTAIGTNDKNNNGWSKDGSCAGQIYIFGGKDMRCRSSDKLFGLTGGGCCDKDKVAAGLVSCKDNEKMLSKKRQNDLCHSVGSYCSKKIKLGGAKMCVQNSDSYCCFNSKLARIFHEQGRPQLGMGWGSSDAPDCRGFKPEEFQKLDMSKMDLSEFTSSLPAATIDTGAIKNKVKNHVNTIN